MTIDPTARAVLIATMAQHKNLSHDVELDGAAKRAVDAWAAAGYPLAPKTGRRVRPLVWVRDMRTNPDDLVATVAGSDGDPIMVVGSFWRHDGVWRCKIHHGAAMAIRSARTRAAALAAAGAWWLEQEQARLAALGVRDAT